METHIELHPERRKLSQEETYTGGMQFGSFWKPPTEEKNATFVFLLRQPLHFGMQSHAREAQLNKPTSMHEGLLAEVWGQKCNRESRFCSSLKKGADACHMP